MGEGIDKTKPITSDKVHIVNWSNDSFEFLRRKSIENVVKFNGRLIIATVNSDYDKSGNFIGDYSHLHDIAEPFVKKYNPNNLSKEDYRAAFEQKELPWQQDL